MEIIKLLLVFAVLVTLVLLKKPLMWAVAAASVVACVLFGIGPVAAAKIAFSTVTAPTTLSMVAVMYLVTLLQKMLQKRGHIDLAQKSLSAIFNSRRVNASIAPIFIGLLPTASSAFIAGDMVEASIGDYLSKEEKAAATSFFRHIPEAFMPTYTAILLALSISGIEAYQFVLGMLIPVLVLFSLGYIIFLRKVPNQTDLAPDTQKSVHIKNLCIGMWSISAIILLILVFKVEVYIAALGVIALYAIVNKFKPSEFFPLLGAAFEVNIMLNLVLLILFKDVLTNTGIINSLPEIFASLPIPAYLVFMLIFFFGTIVSGSQAIIAVCMPLAYAAIPNSGLALLVLLMSASYASMQISPTHICLALISEHFKTNMGALIKKSIPAVAIFMVFVPFYYLLLLALGF